MWVQGLRVFMAWSVYDGSSYFSMILRGIKECSRNSGAGARPSDEKWVGLEPFNFLEWTWGSRHFRLVEVNLVKICPRLWRFLS